MSLPASLAKVCDQAAAEVPDRQVYWVDFTSLRDHAAELSQHVSVEELQEFLLALYHTPKKINTDKLPRAVGSAALLTLALHPNETQAADTIRKVWRDYERRRFGHSPELIAISFMDPDAATALLNDLMKDPKFPTYGCRLATILGNEETTQHLQSKVDQTELFPLKYRKFWARCISQIQDRLAMPVEESQALRYLELLYWRALVDGSGAITTGIMWDQAATRLAARKIVFPVSFLREQLKVAIDSEHFEGPGLAIVLLQQAGDRSAIPELQQAVKIKGEPGSAALTTLAGWGEEGLQALEKVVNPTAPDADAELVNGWLKTLRRIGSKTITKYLRSNLANYPPALRKRVAETILHLESKGKPPRPPTIMPPV